MKTIPVNGQVFGIIGNPISHSISPLLHNKAFEKAGFQGVYVPFCVDQTGPFLKKALLHMGFRGLSVTIPHKIWAAKVADRKDALTELTGAANTLLIHETRKGRILEAMNTDGPGAVRSLQSAIPELKGKRVVIAGYGGSARAIVGQLLLSTAVKEVSVTGRNLSRVRRFVRFFTEKRPEWKTRLSVLNGDGLLEKKFEILINTTPLGMKGFDLALPVPADCIKAGMVVMDIVYNPEITPLLEEAKKKKAVGVPGYMMLLYQALLQFELFTGMKAGTDIENQMRLNLITALRS